jgi:hypothetical protein
LIVQLNGSAAAAGTRFSADFAKTSWKVMPAKSGVYVSDRPVWRQETIKEWARDRPRKRKP